jgi:hypothetical protein
MLINHIFIKINFNILCFVSSLIPRSLQTNLESDPVVLKLRTKPNPRCLIKMGLKLIIGGLGCNLNPTYKQFSNSVSF